MALPAAIIPVVKAIMLNRAMQQGFGTGNRLSVPANPAANPFNDPAIRASLLSQGLATPTGEVPGSNVPSVQTNVPSKANLISNQTGVGGVGGVGGIPTRGVLGLEGDAAFAATATAFRKQLEAQTGANIAMINREFGGAGRFTSGQRLGAIQEEQAGARQEFGRFLGSTALERFLQKQRLQAQGDIARMQIEAQSGQGRTQLFGQGVSALGNIFAQNPQWLIDLFTRSGPGQLSPPADPFDPTATTIQLR